MFFINCCHFKIIPGLFCLFQSFHRQCYKIEGKRDLMSAMNDFLDESVVLPPGDWDSKNLISLSEIQGLRDAKKKQREEELAKEQAEKVRVSSVMSRENRVCAAFYICCTPSNL